MEKFYLVKLFGYLNVRRLEKYQFDELITSRRGGLLIPGKYRFDSIVERDENWLIYRYFAPRLGYFLLVWRKK